MNKLHPPLTCLTLDGEILVEGYKTEKPKPPFIGSLNRERLLQEWQASKVRYPVQEDSEFDLRKQLHSDFICWPFVDFLDKQLEKGIDISRLSDRIEVVQQCKGGKCFNKKGNCHISCMIPELAIKLKPIQEKFEVDNYRYPLFKHMHEEHGKILLESELDEIIRIVKNLNP